MYYWHNLNISFLNIAIITATSVSPNPLVVIKYKDKTKVYMTPACLYIALFNSV